MWLHFLQADYPVVYIVHTCCRYGYPDGSSDLLAHAISNTVLIHIAGQWNHYKFFEGRVRLYVLHRIADNSQLCLDMEHKEKSEASVKVERRMIHQKNRVQK